MSPTVHHATLADVPTMAAALADSFEDDPVMGWLFPSPTKRRHKLTRWTVGLI